MKKTAIFKKLLCLLMACLMCTSMLIACGDEDGTTTPTNPPSTAPTTLDIVKGGDSAYQIVVPKKATNFEMDAAYKIREIVYVMTGKRLTIVEDDEPAKDTEIVIGAKNARNALYTTPEEFDGGYCVFVAGQRFVVAAGSSIGMKRALQNLAYDCFGVNIVFNDFYTGAELSELTVSTDYKISETFGALYFSMVYDGTYEQKRMAYSWRKIFTSLSTTKNIIEMDVYTSAADASDGIVITLVNKETVVDGNWELHLKSNGSYEVYASDYYGFTAAGKYFRDHVLYNRGKAQPLPTSATGNYKTLLAKGELSTAYAFEKTADYRVMLNNILWGSPSPSERTTLTTDMISIYMPDVLGLQEVNLDRRGNQLDGKGGIIAALAELGYAEAIDPRVRNAYPTNETIPGTDASLTNDYTGEIKGYGTGGATKVEVDGETYYTYYNCTPLLYNTATTKLIDGGYYWYKSQWDQRKGMSHENGAGDCASKAATWGLFEDLASGEQYIVISTHMCTRSEYVRGLQGAEVVELVDSLIAEYNVPVIFGGDLNGSVLSSNFNKMVEGGMVDVQSAGLATVYNSDASSHHPYPEYDFDLQMVQPAAGDTSGSRQPQNSIDRILVKNHESMDVTVYGTVIDDRTISGADHFPVFIDFSINSSADQPS